MNPSDSSRSDAARIPVRRIRFSYPTGSLDRHFVGGDLVMSHAIAWLSAVFPQAEDFLIRTVRQVADDITDPELRSRVKGFIGQEATHGREHRVLNERLQAMGYPMRRGNRTVRRLFRLFEKVLSPLTCLALTAAMEHFTAVFAEIVLGDERAQELLGTGEVRSMLLWHAYEESEHRSVAFDAYQAVGGTERRRIMAMRFMMVLFGTALVGYSTLSLLGDRTTYNPKRLARSLAALRHSPFLTRAALRRIGDYNRPGFHPDDTDNSALLQHWSTELFGARGALVDHLT